MDVAQKLGILSDAAKYDASCASSGARGRKASNTGIGSTEGTGICHSYTPDGRCVSLLKILLTNYCIYDCGYCINRRSSGVQRARFSAEEVVQLTLDFYRRNYIEGLFLSSGIIRDADYTMEQLVRVAKTLRTTHEFSGYIHLKTIPNAATELITEAGRWADRLSINVELPRQKDLDRLAPEKELVQITRAMGVVRDGIAEAREDRARSGSRSPSPQPLAFTPAGQATQMIVGATDATDAAILQTSASLYGVQKLKRVYYSAFSPIPDASSILPPSAPPLLREHRLYQADWLMRFYGFAVDELTTPTTPDLDLDIDPKLSWALRNRGRFPMDVNSVPKEDLLRIPGVGVRSVKRIIAARRWHRLRLEDLTRLHVAMSRAMPFLSTADYSPTRIGPDSAGLMESVTRNHQLDLWSRPSVSAVTGEL
ncbi:MAG TPA: putative DNA modification/repair radical SAM protein [Gemmatimonadaceae bacterium]|nr:putative DNA modification/repair radical SAM protein [Gemmatimonadaceae bacterium]